MHTIGTSGNRARSGCLPQRQIRQHHQHMSNDVATHRRRFGARVYAARSRSYHTQAELANALNVGERTIGKIERGEKVSPRTIAYVEEFLGIPGTWDAIVAGEDNFDNAHDEHDDTPDPQGIDDDALVETLMSLRRLVGEEAFSRAALQVLQTPALERRHA